MTDHQHPHVEELEHDDLSDELESENVTAAGDIPPDEEDQPGGVNGDE